MPTIEFQTAKKKLQLFFDKHRRPPSYSEIQDLFGYQSKGAVTYLVRRLIEK